MKLYEYLAIFAIAGSLTVGTAQAQIREQQPAEFPPSSYKGKQYVDSTGCVFIRAGIDGDVSWVPRVTRDRKTVCGFQPSLGAQTAVAARVPATTSQPVQITLNDAASATPVPRPAPQRVATPRATPVVVRQTARRTVAAPKPRVVAVKPVVVAAAPLPAQVRVKRQIVTSCPGASAISQRYLQSPSGLAVRCGPQATSVRGVRGSEQAPPQQVGVVEQQDVKTKAPRYASNVTSTTRIAPKHVVQNRVNTRNVIMPHGYKKVWTDGRLNPNRAEQNLQGRSDMLLIWTQTVPRRLIDTHSGRDVTASIPLIYPYTSVAQQRRDLGEVTIVQRDGQTLKRVVRHKNAKPAARTPVYSSRSAAVPQPSPKPAKAKVVQGKRYVQIGTFRDAANAQRAAQQIARMGMAARIGKHRKGGKSYMTVQAGPFNGSRAMLGSLQQLRGAGYSDAFARN
jgi:cell division protein FtsN